MSCFTLCLPMYCSAPANQIRHPARRQSMTYTACRRQTVLLQIQSLQCPHTMQLYKTCIALPYSQPRTICREHTISAISRIGMPMQSGIRRSIQVRYRPRAALFAALFLPLSLHIVCGRPAGWWRPSSLHKFICCILPCRLRL